MGRVRTGREIDAALRRKGFIRELDGKHIRYFFSERVFTHISHGMLGCTVSSKLISEISRQLRLSKNQFLALIDCTLSEEDYRCLLQEQGEWV
ncbi:MAG: hypothetical protein ACRC10_12230 [Thermoguttaceae bacterium]